MGWHRRGLRRGIESAVAVLASVALLVPLMAIHSAAAEAAAAVPATQAPHAPSAHLQNGECLVSGAPSIIAGSQPLIVAPHPTGVKILWLPGLNSTACAIATTHGGISTAAALARAISHAPAVSNGPERFCPEDDNARVSISFTYARHRSAPPLFVSLDGCRLISQADREQRSTTPAVSDKLAALAPCGWRSYFAVSPSAC